MLFSELKLDPRILESVAAEGYVAPTPIQAEAIPHVLEGRDLLGVAQTGTGKTAAFALPLLHRLVHQSGAPGPGYRPIKALVLTPTRELAAQIGESFATYGRHLGLSHAVIFGGVGQSAQEQVLRRGVDVLVATPGRLLDLMGQGFVRLDRLSFFVLDEADRMLDMGFIHDVRKVLAALPKVRQSLFFSATMPPDIVALAGQILTDPVKVAVTPVSSTAEKVNQKIYFVELAQKRSLLVHLLQSDKTITRVIVFTRTKHGANRVAEALEKLSIGAAAIHGNKSQNARERALAQFKAGTIRVLVATDIAARGIDIEDISHVINYELPNVPEQYVHRIGRTARAGASGVALSFCDFEERAYLRDIERLTQQHVPVVSEHPYPSQHGVPTPTDLSPRRGPSAGSGAGPRPMQSDRGAGHGRGAQGGGGSRGHGGRSGGSGGGGRGPRPGGAPPQGAPRRPEGPRRDTGGSR
ncbi:MAG: DEAD/DEAH box helicase [Myxococcales bacterium]|nr:DEAD/DEAH box helicase [Myxococcales bacterium]